MRFMICMLTLVTLAFQAPSLLAVDLTKVPRAISKEPAYNSKPRYMLLVFGPEAKFRVWLVFDGDVLYVDRNGNGDLTEPGERLEPTEKPTENRFVRNTNYDLGAITDPFTGKKYDKVTIWRLTLKPDYLPKTKLERDRITELRATGTPAQIRLWSGDTITQAGFFHRCSANASQAEIVHLDGPMSFSLVDEVVLQRKGEPADLRVELVTPGLGLYAYTCFSFDIAPATLHPVAKIEFPNVRPGGPVIAAWYTLNDRC